MAEGTAGITASFDGVTSNSATLNVVAPTLVSLQVTPASASVAVGLAQQYTATATYSYASPADVSAQAAWASDNAAATVGSAGLATGVVEGSAGITASFDGMASNSATLAVTPPVVVLVEITSDGDSIALGETQQYSATATYSNGTTVDVTATASWSSDEVVATVNAGLASGVGEGTATITASLGGAQSGPASLAVTPAVLESIEVTPAAVDSLAVDQTQQFTAVGTYSDGTTVDITLQVTWNADESIVTFDEAGSATGVADGTIEVTATLGGVTSNAVEVTVSPAVAWAMIGGIIGGVLAAALLFFFLVRGRRRKEQGVDQAPA
jgi:hypothetical protein